MGLDLLNGGKALLVLKAFLLIDIFDVEDCGILSAKLSRELNIRVVIFVVDILEVFPALLRRGILLPDW